MKKALIISYLFFLAGLASAQINISSKVAKLTDNEEKVVMASLNKYSLVTLDTYSFKKYLRTSKKNLKVDLSLTDELTWNMILDENEIRAENAQSIHYNQDGVQQLLPKPECNTYSGYINDDKDQYVRLFISENQVKGIIVDKNKGVFMI
jgi:hypothetical protein